MRALLCRTSRAAFNVALFLIVIATLVACQAAPETPPAETSPAAAAQSTTTSIPPTAPPASPTASASPTPIAQPTAVAPTAVAKAPAATPEPTEQPGADLTVWSTHERAPGQGTVVYKVHYANLDLERTADRVVLQVVVPEGGKITRLSREHEVTFDGVLVPIGAVQPAGSGLVEIAAQWPEALLPGTWTVLTAQINESGLDPAPANNVAQDGERVAGPSMTVELNAADNNGAYVPGMDVALAVRYANLARVQSIGSTITVTLPSGVTYRSAEGSLAGEPTIRGTGDGLEIALSLRPVQGSASGRVTLRAVLDAGLAPDTALAFAAQIAAPGDATDSDNLAETVQIVQPAGPDTWVQLESTGETALGESHTWRIRYGNRGTDKAAGVTLAFLLPDGIEDVRYSLAPGTVEAGSATWSVGTLLKAQNGRPIEITGVLVAEGPTVARASIATAGPDANPVNDTAEATDEILALAMPIILGPSAAVIDARPVFYGEGVPAATVSLYLASTDARPGELLGTGVVGDDGMWEIAPLGSLPEPGWHWYTATQTLGERVSPVTGAANYTAADLGTDPDSLTVNGQRVGGLDQPLPWPAGETLQLGGRIIACTRPLTPTLLVDYYSADDTLVNRAELAPRSIDDNGYVVFGFAVPRREQEVSWTMALSYYCDSQEQTKALMRLPRKAASTAGLMDTIKRKIDCWFGNCKVPPPPPPPPEPCKGCVPLPPEKRKPKPDFFGPDPDDKFYQ